MDAILLSLGCVALVVMVAGLIWREWREDLQGSAFEDWE